MNFSIKIFSILNITNYSLKLEVTLTFSKLYSKLLPKPFDIQNNVSSFVLPLQIMGI